MPFLKLTAALFFGHIFFNYVKILGHIFNGSKEKKIIQISWSYCSYIQELICEKPQGTHY